MGYIFQYECQTNAGCGHTHTFELIFEALQYHFVLYLDVFSLSFAPLSLTIKASLITQSFPRQGKWNSAILYRIMCFAHARIGDRLRARSKNCVNTLLLSRRQGFNRPQPEGSPDGNDVQQRTNGVQNTSPSTFSPMMTAPGPQATFSAASSHSSDPHQHQPETPVAAEHPKFFFYEKFAKLGVKGNFMPLAAQPVNVDLADWLAHQSDMSPVSANASLTQRM